MKLKKSDYKILFICILLAVISIFLVNFRNKNNQEENKENIKNKYNLVKDYSRFFTVNSCIYKYIVYLETKDYDNLFKILDQNYISKNNINENNLYDFVTKLDGNYSYVSKKMYYENLNDNYIRYYVYGYLYLETIDGSEKQGDYYYIVDLDMNNQLFSIMPYSGNIFNEV